MQYAQYVLGRHEQCVIANRAYRVIRTGLIRIGLSAMILSYSGNKCMSAMHNAYEVEVRAIRIGLGVRIAYRVSHAQYV
jgi:hypothetical protein